MNDLFITSKNRFVPDLVGECHDGVLSPVPKDEEDQVLDLLIKVKSRYLPVLQSGDQESVNELLAKLESMSVDEIKFLMFAASFPGVSKNTFQSVVKAVLRWGGTFRKVQKKQWAELRRWPEDFASAIFWAIADNRILDLMDARLTKQEAALSIGGTTLLNFAVNQKCLYFASHFPEFAVLKFLTRKYSFDSTTQGMHFKETAWHQACTYPNPLLIKILAEETKYGSLCIRDVHGDTPLHDLCAALPFQKHSPEIARFLMAHGIDACEVGHKGKTCEDIVIDGLAERPSDAGVDLLVVIKGLAQPTGGAQ